MADNFMRNMSKQTREWIEIDLVDDYEDVERKRIKATLARQEAKSMRDQAISMRQQVKTIEGLLAKTSLDEVQQKAHVQKWTEDKLKDFGIDITSKAKKS